MTFIGRFTLVYSTIHQLHRFSFLYDEKFCSLFLELLLVVIFLLSNLFHVVGKNLIDEFVSPVRQAIFRTYNNRHFWV